MKKEKIISGKSARARNMAARLAAAQAVYQASQNGQGLRNVMGEYLAGLNPSDGAEMVNLDGELLRKILTGVEARGKDLEEMVSSAYAREGRVLEPLLKAILLCGACEIMGNSQTDAPIIINDYLNVTHSFYEQGEVSLVNGILDAIARAGRG